MHVQEIEVKATVKNAEDLRQKLESLGCIFSNSIEQKDRIFVPKGHDIPVENGVNVFRIREQDGKFILTLKQQVTNQLDCLEYETDINQPEKVVKMIELLGFAEISSVNKTRIKGKYKDLEICLDEVEQLGSFIEVEKMVEEGNAETIQSELWQFLESIGVDKKEQVTDGYDILIKKKLQNKQN